MHLNMRIIFRTLLILIFIVKRFEWTTLIIQYFFFFSQYPLFLFVSRCGIVLAILTNTILVTVLIQCKTMAVFFLTLGFLTSAEYHFWLILFICWLTWVLYQELFNVIIWSLMLVLFAFFTMIMLMTIEIDLLCVHCYLLFCLNIFNFMFLSNMHWWDLTFPN